MPKVHEAMCDRAKWTQGALARDDSGEEVLLSNPAVACLCFLGFIQVCYPNDDKRIKKLVYDELDRRGLQVSISKFNDTHTYEEVLALAKELDV